jgi:hypothetical protein
MHTLVEYKRDEHTHIHTYIPQIHTYIQDIYDAFEKIYIHTYIHTYIQDIYDAFEKIYRTLVEYKKDQEQQET